MNRVLVSSLLTLLVCSLSAQPQDVLRVNFGTSAIEVDPAKGQTALEAQVHTALYEGLVIYDPLSLRPLPGAAKDWSFSDDGLTLTFHLRSGLVFEDGTPLTASVFRNSWLRLLAPGFRAPFASLLDPIVGVPAWREGRSKDPKTLGIEATDDTTLVLRLSEPAPHLVAVLCHYAFVPIHPRWNPSSKTPPPANGPFRLIKTEPAHWILERNSRYWDAGQVSFGGLDFRFNDDAPAVTRAYKEGLLDWVADGIDGSASMGQRYVSANSVFGTSFFYFKTDRAPWNDARVRQALILLLPLEQLRAPYLLPTSALVPQFQGYPEVKGVEKPDQDRALALLAEAGYPKGQGLPPVVVALPDNEAYNDFLDTFREAWKPLDLEVVFKPVKGSYYDQLATLDHTLGHFSWIGDFLDPVTFLVLWKGGSSLNSFSYADADYDALLNKAATQSAEERLKTLAAAETKLLQDGLLVPLSHTPSFHLIDREEIGGWYPNALDIHPFKNLVRQSPRPLKNLARFDLP